MEVSDLVALLQKMAPDLTLETGVNFFCFHGERACENAYSFSRIGVCVDPTEQNITAALNQGVDLLISYHPWYHEAESLVRSQDIKLLSLHTAWDNNPEGVNFIFAKAIGLKELNLTGSVLYGQQQLTFREFSERCQRVLDLNVLPYYGELRAPVNKIGLWAGPGFLPVHREIWESCHREGCDTIVSGEFTIAALRFAALHRLKLIDVGHSAVAKPGMARLAYLLRQQLQDACGVELFLDYYGYNYNTSWFFPERGDTEESVPLFPYST